MTSEQTQQKLKKITLPSLDEKKRNRDPIVQMAIYDYRSAVIADRIGGIDIQCVSDTGGMILFGHQSTTSVTFDEVMSMTKAVSRGSKYGLRMVDMPFWSFHVSAAQAVENAGRFVSEGGAEVMKCEGNQHHAPNIEAIVKAGIPVQGHIGVTPMRMPQLGGFKAQGKTADRAKELVDDAWAMVEAGCFSILCEVTTDDVAAPGSRDLAGRGEQDGRRPHHHQRPVPSLRGACPAALEDLLRHHPGVREGVPGLSRRGPGAGVSRRRAHGVHEGRGAGEVPSDDEGGRTGAGRFQPMVTRP